jgi:hypothetical protein
VSLKANMRVALVIPLIAYSFTLLSEANPEQDSGAHHTIYASLVAHYAFTGGSLNRVRDQSGNHRDGVIVGDHKWSKEGLELGGASYVRIPSSPTFDLSRSFSTEVWYRGKGSAFRAVERPRTGGTNNFRGPYLQVCGDQLSMTYMGDVPDQEILNERDIRESEKGPTFWPASYASALANLTDWSERYLAEGVEPKLQRVFDKVYYEYFGRDGTGVFQIWSGVSDARGDGFVATQRTHKKAASYGEVYQAEQGNLQVVRKRVYYAWVEMDDKYNWQLWTGDSALDGSGFKARQRTVDSGWVPQLQVAGNSIYYMYAGSSNRGVLGTPTKPMYIAKSNLDGSGWRIIATITDIAQTVGGIVIDKDRLFFGYSKLDSDGSVEAMTGSMNLDGSERSEVPRLGSHWSALAWPLQAVGNNIYYLILDMDGGPRSPKQTYWVGSSRRDGTGWESKAYADGKLIPGYTTYRIVGGKTYFGLTRYAGQLDKEAFLGTEGANLVSKGDSFGIGLSESSIASAFINAGEDYLCRGEAPLDTAGATTTSPVQDDEFHQLAAVYDGHTLKLFVDGVESSKTEYGTLPAPSGFPLVLGDGLVGTLKDVKVFTSPLSSVEIATLYKRDARELGRTSRNAK